jgi:beta-galactosidase
MLSAALSAAVASAVLVASPVVPGIRSAPAVQMRNVSTASSAPAETHHAVSWDQYSLKIDGKRIFLWSGELDYWRLPSPDLWLDIMQKIKAAGFNAIATYFNWDYHSPAPGVYNFSGVRDVDRFLNMANQVGLYVIARPGPYINAETDGGGFPGWLSNIKGTARTTDPAYLGAVDQWLSHIDPIIARHQLTNGTGSVIGYQVENEMYGLQQSDASNRAYMADLEAKARADGITVPLLGSDHGAFASGQGAVNIEGWTDYPQGFNCSQPTKWGTLPDFAAERATLPGTPFYLAEYQGGAFDPWGGPGYDSCRELTGPDYERVFDEAAIAAGSTMQNYYMTYGGTSWGWIPYPGVYSSYDYGAAISESRALTAKYSEQKLIGYFTQTVAPLTKTDPVNLPAPTNPAVTVVGRQNPDTGTMLATVRPTDVTATSDLHTHIALPLGTLGDYPSVPQEPGTDLELNGHDSKMLLANYRLGSQRLVYSTSELLTNTVADGRDVAVFYGRHGQDGETVLRYPKRPQVDVLAGTVQVNWDPNRNDLRLDYVHDGLARVLVHTGGRDLLLLLADDATAETFWRAETSAGPVLVRGPELVRSAQLDGGSGIELTGDTAAAEPLEVFAPAGVRTVSWNGRTVNVTDTPSGTLSGSLPGPRGVQLPALTSWRYKYDTPEAAENYDDSGWTVANHTTSNNPHWNGKAPVLDADDYGYHFGDVWYRGHFAATGAETSVTIQAGNSGNDAFEVWLNGQYLGYATGTDPHTFSFPAGAVHARADNVLAVLVENMAHDEDRVANDSYRELRGVQSATLAGSSAPISWRLRGDRGGEHPIDPVRGQMNNGGLHGEWAGYSLPGYPDGSWQSVTLPHAESRPGVGWYRTSFSLHLPSGQDTSVGVSIGDDPGPHYRALIFVNGWLIGRYVADLGPEHTFPVPAGILRAQGQNTIGIAAWGLDTHAGLGSVQLVSLGTYASSLQVHNVNAPGYNPRLYR